MRTLQWNTDYPRVVTKQTIGQVRGMNVCGHGKPSFDSVRKIDNDLEIGQVDQVKLSY